MRKLLVTALLICALAFCLAGCQQTAQDDAAVKLYDAKVEYVGDASAVSGLLSVLLGDRMGLYTIELATDEEPYGLDLNFGAAAPDNAEMERCACVILGLVDNLSTVSWSSDTAIGGSLDLAGAEELVGKDPKSFASSPRRVKKLIDRLELKF